MARGKHVSRGAGRGYARDQVSGRARGKPAGRGSARPGSGRRPEDYAAYEREEATPEYMRRLFARHELEIREPELKRFWRYYLLLRRENQGLHLTRIIGIEATVLKHFLDCAVVARLHPLQGPLLDIGSGPGFPGVPLAIVQPELPVIVAESRGARVRFLQALGRELELPNLRLFTRSVRRDSPFVPATTAGREPSGEAPLPEQPPWPVRAVITRALESIPLTLERVREFLPTGGQVLFMKGPNCGPEVSAAQQRCKRAFRMERDLHYNLGGTRQRRRLVVFTRR